MQIPNKNQYTTNAYYTMNSGGKYMHRLRDLREDKDLKQKELADFLGCSQATYSRYETGALGVPSDTTASNDTKRTFNYNEFVKGISGSNYYYPQFVTSYNIQNQTISMTTGATATYGLAFPINIEASTTYTMSFDKDKKKDEILLK